MANRNVDQTIIHILWSRIVSNGGSPQHPTLRTLPTSLLTSRLTSMTDEGRTDEGCATADTGAWCRRRSVISIPHMTIVLRADTSENHRAELKLSGFAISIASATVDTVPPPIKPMPHIATTSVSHSDDPNRLEMAAVWCIKIMSSVNPSARPKPIRNH